MSRIIVTRSINAPIGTVFKTVADIGQFSKALPHIVKVEFLSNVKYGLGTRFRETRRMKDKERVTELEVTEFVENERIRLIAESEGTVWDSLFTVRPDGARTVLTMTMEARTDKLIMKIINFTISGMVQKAVEGDMDAVKEFCERS
jgi:uncharacterized protein YndB with AHSA1/START domain